MATPNSGPLRVTRQSISHIDMPPATRPILAHRPHTYPHPSSSSTQAATLSSSESSSSLPPAPVIDPSLLAAPIPPPLVNGGINLAMVAPAYSPQVTSSSSAGDHRENDQDYFGPIAGSSAAGPSNQYKDDKAPIQQWDGFTVPPPATLPDWQQQPPTAGEPSRPTQDPDAPYDLARKKDGKIARPPNAWILYRSEMLKHLSEGKPVEGLEAALEELDNPTEDPKDGKKSKKSNKKAPAKGSQELIGQLGGGKGGRGLPQAEISRVISVLWKREDPERRRHYENLAAQAKEEHKKLYPGYKFQPMRKDEKAAHKAARQRERDVCRRTKAGDKAATKITRRRNSRHKRSPSNEFGSTHMDRTDSCSSLSSEQGGYFHGVPFDTLGPHHGYAPYMPAAQPHSTPLMGHLMSTQFPSSSRSGSIALSLPGTSSSPEHHHDFGVERSVPMFASQSDMSYDTLQQSIEFNDAHPMMGYSTMANGYGNSAYVPGRPLPYGQPITAGGRLNHNIPAATPYQFTPMKVPTEYLSHVQGTNEYTDDTITDLAAVWCDIEEPPVPSPAPAATVIPATIGGQTGQTWAEHQRVESANMPRIPMAPPGAGPEAGYSVPQFVNQYENGSGGVMTPQPGPLEVPRMAASVHSSPLSQPIFFDPSKQTQNGVKAEHTPSPSMQHAMTQRAQGGDTLGQGLMPSPVDQSFPQNVILRPVQQGPVASPQPASTYYDANSPSNMLVPRHFSNSIFPLSPTGTQLPSWAQDRSFSSSSQQAQIMPSMSMTPGQLLGDDWEDVSKPPANLASPVPLSQSAPAGTMMQPSQRRVVTGYENPAV